MRSVHDRLNDLRLGDLTTFLAVRRCASITAAARELNVTPSQVSKAIARLEAQLGLELLSRTSRGVSLSEAGRRVAPQIESAVTRLRMLGRSDEHPQPELTVAAPSYLAAAFIPVIASSLPQLRVRSMELPPALMRAYAGENYFDLTLLPSGPERLPSSWATTCIGTMRKGLFASRALAKALGPDPVPVERLRGIPWVMPLGNVQGQLIPADDECPLTASERTAGHEVQTVGVALELAVRSDQLVFGPVLAARRHLVEGTLVEVRVQKWNVSHPLHLACNGDRVMAPVQRAIVTALKGALEELEGTGAAAAAG